MTVSPTARRGCGPALAAGAHCAGRELQRPRAAAGALPPATLASRDQRGVALGRPDWLILSLVALTVEKRLAKVPPPTLLLLSPLSLPPSPPPPPPIALPLSAVSSLPLRFGRLFGLRRTEQEESRQGKGQGQARSKR